jgi:hypothetical protein
MRKKAVLYARLNFLCALVAAFIAYVSAREGQLLFYLIGGVLFLINARLCAKNLLLAWRLKAHDRKRPSGGK